MQLATKDSMEKGVTNTEKIVQISKLMIAGRELIVYFKNCLNRSHQKLLAAKTNFIIYKNNGVNI